MQLHTAVSLVDMGHHADKDANMPGLQLLPGTAPCRSLYLVPIASTA